MSPLKKLLWVVHFLAEVAVLTFVTIKYHDVEYFISTWVIIGGLNYVFYLSTLRFKWVNLIGVELGEYILKLIGCLILGPLWTNLPYREYERWK